jgi:hypothetical protein
MGGVIVSFFTQKAVAEAQETANFQEKGKT